MRVLTTVLLASTLTLFLLWSPAVPVYAQAWWDSNWHYRIPITIKNNVDENLYNYQVLIEVDTASLISAGKMNEDCSDVRFITEDYTELPYWIEPQTINTDNTRIWVKIPTLPASGEVTIYMYYGNPSASSESSLPSVMESPPASDGAGYQIYYQEWVMPDSYFEEIGNAMGWHHNDWPREYGLSFNFPYYSTSYTVIYVHSNGFVAPGINPGGGYADSDENTLKSKCMIAPFWADLVTWSPYDIYIEDPYSDAYGSGIYIRWHTTFDEGTGEQNFALVLYSNGLIRFDYGDIDGTSSDDCTPVIGLSFGDDSHYTISSYSNLQYPSNYNSLMFWPRKKASVEPICTFGSEESLPAGGEIYIKVLVQSSSGEPFSGLRVEAWQGAVQLGEGVTGRIGIASVHAVYGEVTLKILAGGKVINETTVNVVSNGQEFTVTLDCEIIVVASGEVLSSGNENTIPSIALLSLLAILPIPMSRKRRKGVQTWVALVLAIIITIAIAVPIYVWVTTFTSPTETFKPTKLAIVDVSIEPGGAKLTIKNMGEYTDILHTIYIKKGSETIANYNGSTPVYVVTDTVHETQLGNIKLKPGTTITIILPAILEPGIIYTIKIIGKANSITQTEITGE